MRFLDHRGAITFIDASDGSSVCPYDRRELLARFHAAEDGHMLSGAAAFAAMWRAVPLLRSLGMAARNPRLLRALEWLYVRFLMIRPRLQKVARILERPAT